METLTPLLVQAASLMVMGMVLVFLFLGTLVLALKLLAHFCAPKASEAPTMPPAAPGALTPQLKAAITAAVHQHRQRTTG
ncbi:OadG family protein [Ferrimonas balearica]|uniref:OadG family protein n=1 Tax=Ferrimonas balearica TaxID=44012 RepID=UPI001C99CB77|nr:OadG family transporter subunit [Ferrimonas balearica]MBY5990563.1 OadG family protein [Ferrimonas balearica]